MIRGTIRKPNFCNGWNMFVKLGSQVMILIFLNHMG